MQSRKGSSLDKEERTQRQERRKKIEEKIKCDKRGFEFCFMENRSSLKSYLDKRQHPRKKMTMCYQEMDEIRQPGKLSVPRHAKTKHSLQNNACCSGGCLLASSVDQGPDSYLSLPHKMIRQTLWKTLNLPNEHV